MHKICHLRCEGIFNDHHFVTYLLWNNFDDNRVNTWCTYYRRRRSSVNFGGKTFLPENTVRLPHWVHWDYHSETTTVRKINKMPEFCQVFARKIIFPIFLEGYRGTNAPFLASPTPMVLIYCDKKNLATTQHVSCVQELVLYPSVLAEEYSF